ncbi:hypothetical protein BAUCODRAFT_58449, partial [Baudoinia panamericana UAMH 10762]
SNVSAGITLCTGINFTSSCDSVAWPVNECIALNDYSGKTLSFRPDAGFECLLMQDRCNGNEQYADLYHDSIEDSDLSRLSWINMTRSYECFTTTVA